MPKRSVYLQPPDNPYRRNRRDIEFLCNYWNRLLTLNRSYDIRLPELLRANHLMRHLSPLPTSHGLRVDVSFTVFDESDFLKPNGVYAETYQDNAPPYYAELRNSGSCRLPRNGNVARCNNLLRDYARRMSENYAAATERELIRVLSPLIDRDRIAGCQSAFYNQRQAAASNYRFPAGSRASATRVLSGQHDRYVNPRRMNNCHACASFRQKCCAVDSTNENVKPNRSTSQQPLLRQEKNLSEKLNDSPNTANQRYCQNSQPTSFSGVTLGNLQTNDRIPKSRGIALLERNDEAMKRDPNELAEARQSTGETIIGATKTPHSAYTKPAGVATNNDGGSIDPRLGCQQNVSPESIGVTNQNRRAEGRRCGSKRKLDDMEDRATAADLDWAGQDPRRARASIKPRIKNASTMLLPDGNATWTARSRIRNERSSEVRLLSRRHLSSPKYASFLRMFRKEEVSNQRSRENPSFRKNESEKSQRRGGLSTESTGNDDRTIRVDPRIERRTPTPRSTVHTTYNPIMHSSASDPILDSSGITIQLLRLAVLLYAPALMPALNSLIAQQNHQTPVSLPSSEGSNDTWTQMFRLLNEQQATANLSLVSARSERGSSALSPEVGIAGGSPVSSEEQKDIAVKKLSTSQQRSISARTSGWQSDGRTRQSEKDRKWRLTSMLDSGVRLDRSIFGTEDFWKLEEFLKTERRPENVRSLSTRSKNEIVMKEDFRGWMRRLLQQLDAHGVSGNSSSNDEETGCPEGSSKTATDEFSWKGIEQRRNAGRSVPDESLDSSKDDSNALTEHEEGDSDDQKSFASVTSTNSSKSLQLKQGDAKKNESRNENPQD